MILVEAYRLVCSGKGRKVGERCPARKRNGASGKGKDRKDSGLVLGGKAIRKSGRWTFVSTPLEACTISLSPRPPPEDTRAIYDLRLWLAYFDGTGGALWTGFSLDLPSGKLEPMEDLFEVIRDRGVRPITHNTRWVRVFSGKRTGTPHPCLPGRPP